MAFSMHSHSGQFCPGHAKDTLEEVIQTAIKRGMHTFGLTEHMPRDSEEDLYPEEDSIAPLAARHESFLVEAVSLREKYKDQITLLIGFEGEWIRPSYGPLMLSLASNPVIDYFIGSVHHVHGVPIDYDGAMYSRARDISGGTDEKLYEDYFDAQFQMLETLKPRVVGHLDLIRLLSSEPNRDLKIMSQTVWEKVTRNLSLIVQQNGLLEINSSGLRKGMKEPYPSRSICVAYLEMGGKLTLSDDSHGIAQVGACYEGVFEYLEGLGVKEVWTLSPRGEGEAELGLKKVELSIAKASFKA